MDIKEIIQKLQRNPVVMSSIPMEDQMGLPAITMDDGKLCLHFLYYYTKVHGKSIALYPPRYLLKSAFPFNRIVKFEDLSYRRDYYSTDFTSPIAETDVNSAISLKTAAVNELLSQCSGIINRFDAGESISQTEIEAYRRLLYNAVHPAFIQIYRKETE